MGKPKTHYSKDLLLFEMKMEEVLVEPEIFHSWPFFVPSKSEEKLEEKHMGQSQSIETCFLIDQTFVFLTSIINRLKSGR